MKKIKRNLPESGRLIGEDNKIYNKVDLFKASGITVQPVGNSNENVTQFPARSGRIIGEDNKYYNEVELFKGLAQKVEGIEEEVEDLSKLTKWLGVTNTPISENSTVNPIMISGIAVTAASGDIAKYGDDNFKFTDVGTWQYYCDKTDVYTKDETDALLKAKADKQVEILLKGNAPKNLLYTTLEDLKKANTAGTWGETSSYRTTYSIGNATFTVVTNESGIVHSLGTGEAMISESGAEMIYTVKKQLLPEGNYILSAQIDDIIPADAKMYWAIETFGGSIIDSGNVTLVNGYNSADITVSAGAEKFLTVYYAIGEQGSTPVEQNFGTLGTVQTMLRYAEAADGTFEMPYRNQKDIDAALIRAEKDIDDVETGMSAKLDKAGGTVTGAVKTAKSTFTDNDEFVPKGYVDTHGITDYTQLTNKPSINNVTLSANKTLNDLGIGGHDNYTRTSLYNGAFNTADGTITLAESIENFDMLIVELATIGDNIVMNRNNMPIFTNEIVYEDRISYDQAITLGSVHSTIRYCFTDSTTLKVKDVHSTNFAELAPYITKVDGIAYGARRPYKETILYNGGTTAAVGEVQLAQPITDFDAVTMVFGKPDGSSWVKNMFTYPTSTIPNGWTPEYGPIGLYVENDNITFGWNNGNQMYPLKVIGINYGGSVKGRNVTKLYEATDTTAPQTITLSQAYTDFDELYIVGNTVAADNDYISSEESYLTNGLSIGSQLRLLITSDISAIYTIASATELSQTTLAGSVFISNIYGIKYDSDYITIDSEMSDTSENPVQNKVIKDYIDTLFASIVGGNKVSR